MIQKIADQLKKSLNCFIENLMKFESEGQVQDNARLE